MNQPIRRIMNIIYNIFCITCFVIGVVPYMVYTIGKKLVYNESAEGK